MCSSATRRSPSATCIGANTTPLAASSPASSTSAASTRPGVSANGNLAPASRPSARFTSVIVSAVAPSRP